MTPEEKQIIIIQRLEKAFKPEQLEVIDESNHHQGHAGHQGGGFHFAIIISSPNLNQLSRVQAHRSIYAVLADMMHEQIHALRIVMR